MMTENGQSAQVDNVTPRFDSFALTDLWEPDDRLVVNVGARFDRFAYSHQRSRSRLSRAAVLVRRV